MLKLTSASALAALAPGDAVADSTKRSVSQYDIFEAFRQIFSGHPFSPPLIFWHLFWECNSNRTA